MRQLLIVFLLFAPASAFAEQAKAVVGCDNLVTLRRLMMQSPDGEDVPAEFTGCRAVPLEKVGDVEKRAMIGDAPYECRNVKEASCLWLRP